MADLLREKFSYWRKKFSPEDGTPLHEFQEIEGEAFFVEPMLDRNSRIVYTRYPQSMLTGLDCVSISIERYYANEEHLFALKRARQLSGLVSVWITTSQVVITFQHEFFRRGEPYLPQIRMALWEMYRRSFFKLTRIYNGNPLRFAQYDELGTDEGFEVLLNLFQP